MKLIDLLVQELPSRGGWPSGVLRLEQDSKGQFFEMESDYCSEFALQRCESWIDDTVTKVQYEEALVASRPQWGGEGLPPVGCFVEFTFGPHSKERGEFSGNLPLEGQVVEVVSKKVTSDGNDVAVVYWDDEGAGRSACFVDSCFKPIRSEADKKRNEAIEVMASLIYYRSGYSAKPLAKWIFDEIAAGKIPGVKMED